MNNSYNSMNYNLINNMINNDKNNPFNQEIYFNQIKVKAMQYLQDENNVNHYLLQKLFDDDFRIDTGIKSIDNDNNKLKEDIKN